MGWPRLAFACAAALASPHPVSFREGGYLPVAAMVPELDSWDMMAMFALLFGVYGVLWLSLALLVRHRPR